MSKRVLPARTLASTLWWVLSVALLCVVPLAPKSVAAVGEIWEVVDDVTTTPALTSAPLDGVELALAVDLENEVEEAEAGDDWDEDLLARRAHAPVLSARCTRSAVATGVSCVPVRQGQQVRVRGPPLA